MKQDVNKIKQELYRFFVIYNDIAKIVQEKQNNGGIAVSILKAIANLLETVRKRIYVKLTGELPPELNFDIGGEVKED